MPARKQWGGPKKGAFAKKKEKGQQALPLPDETAQGNLGRAVARQTEGVGIDTEKVAETDLFSLTNQERTLIHEAVGDLDVKVKACRRSAVQVGLPTMPMDIQRQHISTIKVNIRQASATQKVPLVAALRLQIGNALSLRARWWKGEIDRLELKRGDTTDANKALSLVKALAKKFGEQLVLEIADEPEDRDEQDDLRDGAE